MSRLSRWLTACVALAAVAGAPGVATATFSGQNGMFAFVRDFDIWVGNPDGTGVRQVTTDPRDDRDPAWSPDGSTIAFSRRLELNMDPQADIWTIRPDGSGRRRVTSAVGIEEAPTWDPTGKRIAYIKWGASFTPELHTVRADGSGDRRIYTGPHGIELFGPAWGPEGQRIAFVQAADSGNCLLLVRYDGTKRRVVYCETDPNNFLGPAQISWSPDGKRIAFDEGVSRPPSEGGSFSRISTITPEGTGLRHLSEDGARDIEPSWSPDGTRIAFRFSTPGAGDDSIGIWTMNTDGSDRRLAIPNPFGHLTNPDWQPLR